MLAWHVCLWKRNKNKREDTLQVLSWPWCSVERRFACGASGGQAYGQQECVTWVLAHFRSPLVPTTTTICHYARMLTKKMEGSAIRHSSARSVFPTTTNKTLWTRHSHTLTVWMREYVCVHVCRYALFLWCRVEIRIFSVHHSAARCAIKGENQQLEQCKNNERCEYQSWPKRFTDSQSIKEGSA